MIPWVTLRQFFFEPSTFLCSWLEELCRRNYGWDEEIPQALKQQWINWLTDLKGISEFRVSRCLKPNDFGTPVHAQSHHFADASEMAW